jgi:hypothetical protein
MIEPVELADFFVTFFSAAMVILSGALYALLFAWSRVHARPRLMPWAYASYGVLFVSVLVLMQVANMNTPFWIGIGVLMLVGYLLAPHGIWHLCTATHACEHEDLPDSPQHVTSVFQPRKGG